MISDDDLLLYYYRDGLDATAACANRHRACRATGACPTPASAGRTTRHRCGHARGSGAAAHSAALGERVGSVGPGQKYNLARFAAFHWQAAAAAVVAVVLLVTVQLLLRSPQEQPIAAATPLQSAYERGLRWHLASTEQGLAEP